MINDNQEIEIQYQWKIGVECMGMGRWTQLLGTHDTSFINYTLNKSSDLPCLNFLSISTDSPFLNFSHSNSTKNS